MQTLIITLYNVPTTPDGQTIGTLTYERVFTSLESFLGEFSDHYNSTYGTDGWSVAVKE